MTEPAAVLWSRRVSVGQYLRNLGIVESCPPMLQGALAERYAAIAGPERRFYVSAGRVLDSFNDADGDLRRIGHELRRVHPAVAFDDDSIEAAADRAARHCMAQTSLEAASAYATAHGVPIPRGPRVTVAGLWKRLKSADWWRRRLRVALTRECEALFRKLGFVRDRAAPYVSDDALRRVQQAQAKGRRWMAETLAVCEDTGESIPLERIAEHSLAQPSIRRGELMTRARGFQETAQANGHVCIMATLTCPSAFHAYLHGSGEPNPRYNGTTPRQAQAWLSQHWARARAALKRRNVLLYGFRCAEPHHDGCPHWHAVLYVPPSDAETLRDVLTRVWLKDFSDEPGAAEHRVKFTQEDPAKGSGCGYLAKYVAKNLDGAGSVGSQASDESGRPVSEDAQRAVAWARVWGIRQFQQIGGPAVGAWRELRRVREPCDCAPLEELRLCTDHTPEGGPSWAAFIQTLGGVDSCLQTSRELLDHALPRRVDPQGRVVIRLSRWGELPAPVVVGLQMIVNGRINRLPTRVHVWVLVFAPFGQLGPVAITVLGASSYGSPAGWTNPNETSTAPPLNRRHNQGERLCQG